MKSYYIRDIPDDTYRALRVAAAEAGQTLKVYLLQLLARETGQMGSRKVVGVDVGTEHGKEREG